MSAISLCKKLAELVDLVEPRGKVLYVGGCVRDEFFGVTPKDYDVEIYGVEIELVEPLLQKIAPNVMRVGRSFPVWKIWDEEMDMGTAVDVALPRSEVKNGIGHVDFEVVLDPYMSFEESFARRDFTINAIGKNVLTGEIIDVYGGQSDIKNGVLRHVSNHFSEDPLRVLRGAQFCARFNLTPTKQTIDICREITPENLSSERINEEWQKLILKGDKISLGLKFLRDVGWIKYFPELSNVWNISQNPKWHPEGCVGEHICHCMDAFAKTRVGDDKEDLIVGFAALCHDFGKVSTTSKNENGDWIAHGHEKAGEDLTRSFMLRLTNETDLINKIVDLVVNHMVPKMLYTEATKGENVKNMNRSVRRLAQKVNLERLARIAWIDSAGRPPLPQVSPDADWLCERAAALNVVNKRVEPILMGRNLIELGMKPGIQFKEILSKALELQLDGEISTLDNAIEWAKVEIQKYGE